MGIRMPGTDDFAVGSAVLHVLARRATQEPEAG
jgi:hypothetical protein